MKKLTLATLLLSLGVYANANIHKIEMDTCIDTSKHSNKSFKQMKQLLVSTMQEKAYNKLYKEQTGKTNKNKLTSKHREDLYVEVKDMYDKGNNFCNKATVSIKDKRLQYYLPQKVSLDRICHKDEDLSPNKLKEQAELKTYKALIAEVSKKEISNEQAKALVHNYKKTDGKMYMSKGAYCLGASGEVIAFEVESGVAKAKAKVVKKKQTVKSLDKGLVAHYKFDGNSKDSSGNGYHGIEIGNTTYKSGLIGQAISTGNSTKDYFKVDKNIKLGKKWTFSQWVKLTKKSSHTISIANKKYDNAFLIKPFQSKNYGYYHFSVNNKFYKGSKKLQNLKDNNWHLLNVKSDGKKLYFYLDGNLIETFKPLSNLNIQIKSLIVGQEQDKLAGGFQKGQWLAGFSDDLRIYNRALSQSEISSLYKQGTN